MNIIHRLMAKLSMTLSRGVSHKLTPSQAPGENPEGKKQAVVDCTQDAFTLLSSSQGRLPSGWVRIIYTVNGTSSPATVTLFPDPGTGFNRRTAVQLPLSRCSKTSTTIFAHFPDLVQSLGLSYKNGPPPLTLGVLSATELGRKELALAVLKQLLTETARTPLRGPSLCLFLIRVLKHNDCKALVHFLNTGSSQPVEHAFTGLRYRDWITLYDSLSEEDCQAMTQRMETMEAPPVISLLLPVENPSKLLLRRTIESILNQKYPHWELCIACHGNVIHDVRTLLENYTISDPRIRLFPEHNNKRLYQAAKAALSLALGHWAGLLGQEDELPSHALYMAAETILAAPDLDMLYSDEDAIDIHGRRSAPRFKPDCNPDLLLSGNYIGRLTLCKRSLLEALGGFLPGFEGEIDHDLALRILEHCGPKRIGHIPHVLYHRRFLTQRAPEAVEASRLALVSHLERVGTHAKVKAIETNEDYPAGGWFRIHRPLPVAPPRISIIIPTRNRLNLLRPCVEGVLKNTNYTPFEVIILDNNSDDSETLIYLKAIARDKRVRVLPVPEAFNYSAINNYGVSEAQGDLIALCNNDLRVMHPDWLSEMASHALRPDIGAVGAKLLYDNDRIQHAGVILGVNGMAGHAHKLFPGDADGYCSRLKVIHNLSALTAACLVMRRTTFMEVGGLNEKDLKVAFNDVDLCLRIREAGYRLLWTPFAQLVHLESASRGDEESMTDKARFQRELNYMRAHWGGELDNDPAYSPNLTLDNEHFILAHPHRAHRPWKKLSPSKE